MSESKLQLKENPTLKDYQEYVALMVKERGVDGRDLHELVVHLMEEVGEMSTAIREYKDQPEQYDRYYDLEDVFCFTLQIANHLGIDLEEAFRAKEEENNARKFK